MMMKSLELRGARANCSLQTIPAARRHCHWHWDRLCARRTEPADNPGSEPITMLPKIQKRVFFFSEQRARDPWSFVARTAASTFP